jgi:CheY-like chemotaxis protein
VTEPSDPHRDLAGVLHDVSNALTVLLGWVAEARAPDATAESVTYALAIIEQRARIARDLARHAIGSPRIDEQREIGLIVEEVGRALVVLAQHSGTRLVVTGGDVLAKVAGALDVSQVLTNVVLNAFAYAPKGTAVEVNVFADDKECTVIVIDDGPGVAIERREAIFNGDSLRPGGTGVGLRHSRALARVWGGDVELMSHEHKGARFRVTWPRIDAIPRAPTSTSRISNLSGLRVLVVEDDLAVTQLLEAALEARGATVTIAKTAAELTASLEVGAYDAALIDLSPIKADAPGAIAKLRACNPLAAVILVTGNADALPVSSADDTVELVRKPFEIREVLAVLARVRRRG